MGKIVRLDPKIANMIAAGEVVEKISNVVKELLENSIDASATVIRVILEESGLKKIQVIDNGIGMDEEDALLAFERHATSKIRNEYDLFHIRSLGFRGEALPSIASVSQIELDTSTGEEGIKLVLEEGEVVSKQVGRYQKGSSIKVSKLFYHTPARYKYLKTPQTELSNIIEIVNKFSISYPDISFSLSNNDRLIFQTSGNGNTLDVLAKIYGIEVAKSMRRFSGKNRDYEINGFISNPIQNRSSKNYISVFVNHRYIKSPRLMNTIIESYGALIPNHRYPIVYLHINVDPSLIDVNIHPTKQEVKFSEEDRLLQLIKHTIESKLELVEVIQPVSKMKEYVEEEQITIDDINDDIPLSISDAPKQEFTIQEQESSQVYEHSDENLAPKVRKLPVMEYIGQFHGTYLIFQNNDGIFLMDQHAAAERIRYERYRKRMSAVANTSYQLLIPMKIELSNDLVAFTSQNLTQIQEFGIELTQQTNHGYEIKSIPSWFPRGYEVVYVESVIMTLYENKTLSVATVRDELAKLLSCKHSLKANAYISKIEADQLLHDLNQCITPYTCPHGRPILLSMGINDIEKWFQRIQG